MHPTFRGNSKQSPSNKHVIADGGYITPFLNEASTGNTGTTRRCSSYANEEHLAVVTGELESSDCI